MQISDAAKSSISSRAKPVCCFSFHYFFQAVYIVYTSLHLTFCTVQPKYCRRAAKPAKSVMFFRRISSPLSGGCKRPGFPIQMLFTSFLRISIVILCFFACKTQSPPGRSRLASLSTNIICRIFSGMCYFFEKIF